MTTPTPPAPDDELRQATSCPSDCDPDCDAPCHEGHAVPWKRRHSPEACPGMLRQALTAAIRAAAHVCGPDCPAPDETAPERTQP